MFLFDLLMWELGRHFSVILNVICVLKTMSLCFILYLHVFLLLDILRFLCKT